MFRGNVEKRSRKRTHAKSLTTGDNYFYSLRGESSALFSSSASARHRCTLSVHRTVLTHACLWVKYLRCSDETSTNETAYQQQRRVHPPFEGNPYPLTTAFSLLLSISLFLSLSLSRSLSSSHSLIRFPTIQLRL